jgi:hypothetical protein
MSHEEDEKHERGEDNLCVLRDFVVGTESSVSPQPWIIQVRDSVK